MSLFNAITTKDTLTENGMPTNSTTSNPVLDFFFKMGGWGNSDHEKEYDVVFTKAFRFDPMLATKALFYHRDVREGQGRRSSFRHLFNLLCRIAPEVAIKNIPNVPFYGRWDDLFAALGTDVEIFALRFIWKGLLSKDALCAKWMPRENKKFGNIAKMLMKRFELTPRQYRKLLSYNTKVIETLMCSNKWSLIDYNKVPSQAMSKLKRAFSRHDKERFSEWLNELSKPDSTDKVAKINAGAIYPHEIIQRHLGSNVELMEAQWKALKDFVTNDRKFLPVCDVSGSMRGEPLDVCVSLGIYLSERNKSIFKNGFITFSGRPTLQILSGTLYERIHQLKTAHWEMNTDLEAVFKLILNKAVESNVSQEDMPDDIIILSDMQFDACIRSPGDSALEMIRRMYREAGYRLPNVIFWNLRTSSGVPVKFNEKGVALVSGFSPSIMKSVFGKSVDPMEILKNTLLSERYERVTI